MNQRFWSVYARVYDLVWDSPLTRDVNRAVYEWCGIPGVGVDLGVGTGLGCQSLTEAGWTTIGVDANPVMLKTASNNGRCTRVVEADAANTGLPDHFADLVIVANILHLHSHPQTVLEEASRLARPEGRVVCVWPHDGAGLATAFRADLRSGRSWGRSLLAAGLRLLIGIVGGCVGARKWSGDAVSQVVGDWAASGQVEPQGDGVLWEIEQYAVFSVPASRPT